MNKPYLYEFLYRGRPEGDSEPPAWHVVIGQMVQLPGAAAPQFVSSGPLTPEQAEAAGHSLSAVLDGINAAALAGRDAAVADAAAARRERDDALRRLAEITAPTPATGDDPVPDVPAA
ncbi:hypothetical protein SAMN02799631_04327 [Methylobacterium sp. 174MFSha1.1]|uniref:hypothetical protein n=1 Tax=Methylobacterium sp. 174MFSha1.1 TaxID=1502749 RepID=UPI0008ED0F10|nr:hypothetical protein [Methylobacterium sp. 174MFSha1.1]SFV05960.1 hypothetical protein SAMN02799631_04327 [Methylobacterium sp. 174MFSha1.1]